MGDRLFDLVSVDLVTGQVTYPQLEGFELDMNKVERTAAMFLPFCRGDMVMAVRQAVHQQLLAHQGQMSLRRGMRRAG